ncbi:PREDICTED: nuclear factor erythroid 2-related factor 3-like [Mesitornis unicolor]|uniref:nuclear factor erythroid 2-related factor 3-like n=1 Tax=Mesitornis unicolor TaxID=54374 RepID=UPI000528CA2D|nr:PREDICTED: nuclear factor erythroid 2-related factor 3-like [Mesitornis unicolor]
MELEKLCKALKKREARFSNRRMFVLPGTQEAPRTQVGALGSVERRLAEGAGVSPCPSPASRPEEGPELKGRGAVWERVRDGDQSPRAPPSASAAGTVEPPPGSHVSSTPLKFLRLLWQPDRPAWGSRPPVPPRKEDGATVLGSLRGAGCSMAEDVDLKACQETLDECCPHQGESQLKLQEDEKEEDINQSSRSHADSLLFFEGHLQLLPSQMENVLETTDGLVQGNTLGEIRQDLLLLPELPVSTVESIRCSGLCEPSNYKPGPKKVSLLEDTQLVTSSTGQDPSSSLHNISLTQTFCHRFSPHDATLLRTDYPTRSNSETRHLHSQVSFPQSSSNITISESLLHGSNLTGLFPMADIVNLMAHDDNFDEIKLMALKEGLDTVVYQLFEEPEPDSGLSLNSSHSTTSYSVCTEGAVGYSSAVKSVSSHGLGVVGGHSQDDSKCGHVEYLGDSKWSREDTLQQLLHNHTYNQLPSQAASTLEHHQQTWMEKQNEVKDRCHNSTTDTNLSYDEHCAKALRIPFSVHEIARMPVDSFNTMLAKNRLTDTQVSLLRDIRRRGRNRVAAQNYRKRKLDAIHNLEEDINVLQTRKESLKEEHSQCSRSIKWMKRKFNSLYRDIFSRLRDDQGRPIDPYQYVIHCSSNGSVLIPKHLVKSEQKQDTKKGRSMGGHFLGLVHSHLTHTVKQHKSHKLVCKCTRSTAFGDPVVIALCQPSGYLCKYFKVQRKKQK